VYSLLPLDAADLEPIDRLLAKYQNLCLDLADAALMYLAEREAIRHVFTLDRRDFSLFRTNSGIALELLPDKT
jgi:predicted nucleic acid-binding protein